MNSVPDTKPIGPLGLQMIVDLGLPSPKTNFASVRLGLNLAVFMQYSPHLLYVGAARAEVR